MFSFFSVGRWNSGRKCFRLAVLGAVISSNYDGTNSANATKNFVATINGSLNSIESTTAASNYSGLGNAVVGTANRIYNSNGSLIFGAGNEITNSITDINASIITPGLLEDLLLVKHALSPIQQLLVMMQELLLKMGELLVNKCLLYRKRQLN